MELRNFMFVLLLSMLIASSIFAKIVSAQATIYVDPATRNVQKGEEFTIDINIDNVTNLYGYEIYLSFNNSVLNATAIDYRNFLNEPTLILHQEVNNTVRLTVMSLQPATPKNGSSPPPLATVHFKSIEIGTPPLNLSKTKLSDNQGHEIPHQTSDGIVIPEFSFATIIAMMAILAVALIIHFRNRKYYGV